jgi:hypothetical protein
MKTRFMPIVGVLLAAGIAVSAPAPRPEHLERLQRLQRDQKLVETLIEAGLVLAAEKDALGRAGCCNGLIRELAVEVRQAATSQDDDRAVEMGGHLEAIVRQGVAHNLRAARKATAPGSDRDKKMHQIGTAADVKIQPLEVLLENIAPPQRERLADLLARMQQARLEVAKSMQLP